MVDLIQAGKIINETAIKYGFKHQVVFREHEMVVYLSSGELRGCCTFFYSELDNAVEPMSLVANRLQSALTKALGEH